ncbi:MAG: hypothetical protein HGA85_08575 [Nanoarchaeota archaeon]|nr:hypothetical protein [Nanoarchaeota archaeon]
MEPQTKAAERSAIIEVFTSPTCPFCPGAVKIAKELENERKEVTVKVYSTATPEGNKRAGHLDVRSVPTMFVTGPGYPDRIGYVGVPSRSGLTKMVNISLGKESWEEKEEGFISRIINKFKGGKTK